MEKTDGMFYQRCLKTDGRAIVHFEALHTIANPTVAITASGLAAVRKNGLLLLRFIGGILIVLFSLTGCVDSPYSGSQPLPYNVDEYISRPDSESICLQSGTDRACLQLIPKSGGPNTVKVPIIHIHPKKLVYIFYHENRQILRAERAVDTREIVEALTSGTNPDSLPRNVDTPGDVGGDGNPLDNNNPPPVNNNSSGNNNPSPTNNNPPPSTQTPVSSDRAIDAHHVYNDVWIIWIGYPEGIEPTGPPVLEKSGLNIKINGEPVTSEDIRNFAQVEDFDGKKGIQFFYSTGTTNTSALEIEVKGLVKDEETVKFTINSPVYTSSGYVPHQTTPP